VRRFDVVVIGAGLAGGLPAAAYLQKAGLAVALVEREGECGRFYGSYELVPGLLVDHSPVNFSCLAPALLDLELERYGYRIRLPELLYGVVSAAGPGVVFAADRERTRAEVARLSPRDADAFLDLIGRLGPVASRLLRLVFFTPHPHADAWEEAVELSAGVLGVPRERALGLTAPDLLEELFESERVRTYLTALPALNLFGDLLEPGQGALAWLWTLLMRSCVSPGGNAALVRALERAFIAHGGTLLRATRARELVLADGEVRGVVVEGGTARQTLAARVGVISNAGAAVTRELLAGHPFGERLAAFETAGRVIAACDLVLRRPLAWPGDSLVRAPRVYLAWDDWSRCREWLERTRTGGAGDASTYLEAIELTQFHVPYGAARDGRVALRLRFGTGPYLDGDWDERRDALARAALACLAAADAGVADGLLAQLVATPLDFWRANAAAAHGNPVGGDFVAGQWIGERLPYRTPVPGLYLSNGVWPPALSYLAPGTNAAEVVARDAGLRRPPWWRHEPGDWLAAAA
jgi:phytoene dehydrogenase-like protein